MNFDYLNIFLQKFESPMLNSIFNYITLIGYELGVTIILCIYLFGFSFHKGFFVIQTSFLTFTLTDILKNIIMINRPFINNPKIKNLDTTMIKEIQKGNVSYSFPSGHSSGITTTLGSIAILIKNKTFYLFSVIVILLVLFSRIYLGVHSLLDVIGGFFLAIAIILIYYIPLNKYIEGNKNFPFNFFIAKKEIIFYFLFFIFLPICIILIPVNYDKSNISFLAGINCGYLLLFFILNNIYKNKKNDKHNYKNSFFSINYDMSIFKIILRIIIGFTIYLTIKTLLSLLFKEIFQENLVNFNFLRILRYIILGILTVTISIFIFLKTKIAQIIIIENNNKIKK